MKNNLTPSLTCRFCKTPLQHTFVDLGMSPIANDYVPKEREHAMEPFYPLHVFVCGQCHLVQLPNYRREEEIFTDEYAYFSSYSSSWLAHSKEYVDMMMRRFGFTNNQLVVELASNDGYLLQYFKEHGIPVLGVEPTANTAKAAELKGIQSIVKFFGVDTAWQMKKDGQMADLLIGNNVLAHVPDLNDFVAGIPIILKESGVMTIEFPHLLQLMQRNQFDTIYHEHYSYYSFLTVERIFAHHGITLFDVEEIPTHGGSLRIYGCHTKNKKISVSANVGHLRQKERAAGLDRLETYTHYTEQVKETKRAALEFFIHAKRAGKTIVGYGAPAKGNTFLNYCGIRTDVLDYTVDASPHKQNHFLPGVRIPIYHPDKIKETKPDYVFILPWNLKDEVMEQHGYIGGWGGKFVVAIPRLEIFRPPNPIKHESWHLKNVLRSVPFIHGFFMILESFFA